MYLGESQANAITRLPLGLHLDCILLGFKGVVGLLVFFAQECIAVVPVVCEYVGASARPIPACPGSSVYASSSPPDITTRSDWSFEASVIGPMVWLGQFYKRLRVKVSTFILSVWTPE